MQVWLILLVPSALVGLLCALFINRNWAIILAAVIPWLSLLIYLLYTEYYIPYQGGGASMWPIAQLFAGTIAAITGVISYKLTKIIKNSEK
jgi:hypothetical protein